MDLCNGQPGALHTLDRFPLVSYDPQDGNLRTTFREVGLKLTPTTLVDSDGANVHCRLHGEFTILKELLAGRYPLERTVTFDGEVDLKDGETMILDGLLTPQLALEAVTAVPLLADLPVMGHLFRDVDPNESLYLMITPNVMK